MSPIRKAYRSDDEWALVAPHLTLVREAADQREHPLRQVFNGLRYVVKTGAPWRWMPIDLPPWAANYQWSRRLHPAGYFEQLAEELRAVLRLRRAQGESLRCHPRQPHAARDARERRAGPL